jgi:uncharacterized membrane protein YkgB
MDNEVFYAIGQGLGILAVIVGFISYQMKTQRGIIALQMATALIFTLHYVFIGAPTAIALNLLGAVSCVFYYLRDKRGGKGLIEPIIFAVLIIVSSILTWEGWYSALIMVGLVFNTLSLTFSDPQRTRAVVFIKSPLCLIYNAIVLSGGGVIYECAVLTSAIIGIIKNKRVK